MEVDDNKARITKNAADIIATNGALRMDVDDNKAEITKNSAHIAANSNDIVSNNISTNLKLPHTRMVEQTF